MAASDAVASPPAATFRNKLHRRRSKYSIIRAYYVETFTFGKIPAHLSPPLGSSNMVDWDPTISYLLLCLVKWTVWLVELVTDGLFGYTYTRGSAEERCKAQEYSHSAQLVTVLWKAKWALPLYSTEDNFLYKHEKYVNPNWVVEHKNATLLCVTDKHVLFTVSDPEVDVHDPEKFPFVFISQFLEAKQLIILPTSSFHQLADEVGDPKVPVGLTNMTARCGSTLIAQMIKKVPNSRVISENWATVPIHMLSCAGHISEGQRRALLRSSFRLLCKISPGENVDRIFMKMTPQNAPQFHIIAELFPQFKLFFNTRHPVPSMRSFKQIFDVMTKELYMKLGIGWRIFFGRCRLCFPYDNKYDRLLTKCNPWYRNITIEEMSVGIYSGVLANYFDHKDIYHHVILYENLSESPEKDLRQVFKLMGIPMEHLSNSLKALEKDSQRGTFGERKKARSFVLPEDQLRHIDQYMAKCSIPIRHDMTDEEFKKVFGV